MQILKRGTLPSDLTYNATCHHCKTEIRFKQSEGKVTHDQREGSYVSVNCPVCGGQISVGVSTHSKMTPEELTKAYYEK